jgi:hypothetical protein
MFTKVEKLRRLLKRDEEEVFYTAMRSADVKNGSVPDLLKDLRKQGILILTGQIEDCCTDWTFTQSKKLSLERIFKVNRRLARGEDVTDIFDPSEFRDFFKHVLKGATTTKTQSS